MVRNKLLVGAVTAVCGLFLLTGCGGSGNKVTCTMEQDGNEAEIVAELDDDDKVKSLTATMTFADEDTAKESYEYIEQFVESAKLKGKTITISDYAEMTGSNAVGKTKAEFVEMLEDSGYKCK